MPVSLSAASVRAGQTLTVTLIPTEAPPAAPTRHVQAAGPGGGPPDGDALGGGRYRVVVRRRDGTEPGRRRSRSAGRDTGGGTEHDLSAGRGAMTGLYTGPTMTAAEPDDRTRADAAAEPRSRPVPASGSSSRRTTRPRTSARSAPRSWPRCHAATLLVVDDGSPDGTGRSPTSSRRPTDGSASAIGPRSRASAGPTSTASASPSPVAPRRSSRWTPTGRTTRRVLPSLVAPIADDEADLVIGSRYVRGGGVVDWGIGRRVISRGGSLFARIVLGLGPHDLTGGFKAWRAETLAGDPVRRHPRRRLRLPDRDDLPRLAPRGAGPRGADHVPRPARRPVEDEPADRRRGARRRRPAAGRGAAGPVRPPPGRCRTTPSDAAPPLTPRWTPRRRTPSRSRPAVTRRRRRSPGPRPRWTRARRAAGRPGRPRRAAHSRSRSGRR